MQKDHSLQCRRSVSSTLATTCSKLRPCYVHHFLCLAAPNPQHTRYSGIEMRVPKVHKPVRTDKSLQQNFESDRCSPDSDNLSLLKPKMYQEFSCQGFMPSLVMSRLHARSGARELSCKDTSSPLACEKTSQRPRVELLYESF